MDIRCQFQSLNKCIEGLKVAGDDHPADLEPAFKVRVTFVSGAQAPVYEVEDMWRNTAILECQECRNPVTSEPVRIRPLSFCHSSNNLPANGPRQCVWNQDFILIQIELESSVEPVRHCDVELLFWTLKFL